MNRRRNLNCAESDSAPAENPWSRSIGKQAQRKYFILQRVRDSNPRNGLPLTRSPGVPLKPLEQLSMTLTMPNLINLATF